jgi:cytochrome c biogenesis protein CcdA
MILSIPLVTGTALLDSINPCAISVLLLISVNTNRRRVISISGVYILGIFLTYIFIGIGILSALTFFGIPHIMTKIGALILILVGLLNLGEVLIPSFPVKLVIPSFIKPQLGKLIYKSSYPSAFVLGVLILSLLHDKSTVISGTLWLIYYNILFVSPLIIILILATSHQITSKLETWRHANTKKVSLFSAIATLILGFVIFFL